MSYLKKYIPLVLVIGLCLHTTHVDATEWSYCDIPLPGSEEVAASKELFTVIKDMSKDHPYVLVSAAVGIMGTVLSIRMRHSISQSNQYKKIEATCAVAQSRLENRCASVQQWCGDTTNSCINSIPMPGFFRNGLKTCLGYLGKGIINLLPFNKKFVAASFCVWGAGAVLPFCNLGATFVLLVGYLNGMRAENTAAHKATLDAVVQAQQEIKIVQKNIKELQETVASGFSKAETNKKELLDKVSDVSKSIEAQVGVVGKKVEDGVNAHVDEKFAGLDLKVKEKFGALSEQINAVTKQCVELNSGNDQVKSSISGLESSVLQLRNEFSSSLNQAIDTIQGFTTKAFQDIASLKESDEDRDAKMGTLITQVANFGGSLDALRTIQSNNGQLLAELQKNDQKNTTLLHQLFQQQERSDIAFSEKMNGVHGEFQKFEGLVNSKFSIMEERVSTIEKQNNALVTTINELKVVVANQGEYIKKLAVQLEKRINSMDGKLDTLVAATTQQSSSQQQLPLANKKKQQGAFLTWVNGDQEVS